MMKENWVYCRGDIYCAKLDPVVGSEQGGIRPVIVIQNDTGNKHAPTLIVATVTTRIHKKANMPTHFVIYDNPAFKEASVVQLEQIRTIDKSRIDNYLGKVTPREMRLRSTSSLRTFGTKYQATHIYIARLSPTA